MKPLLFYSLLVTTVIAGLILFIWYLGLSVSMKFEVDEQRCSIHTSEEISEIKKLESELNTLLWLTRIGVLLSALGFIMLIVKRKKFLSV